MTFLDIKNAIKEYAGFTLKIDVFQLKKGSVKALVGKNGAGKTTLLKAILDQIKLDQGSIQIGGSSNNASSVKNNIGFSFGDVPLFNPDFHAIEIDKIMKNIYQKWDSQFYFSLLNQLAIPTKKTFTTFSTGMKVKLNLVTALAHRPNLLILDEITSSLDPISRKEILFFLKTMNESHGTTILFSTHIIEDLKDIADSVSIIREGEIVLDETIRNMETKYQIQHEFSNKDQIVFDNGSENALYISANKKNSSITIREIIEYCLE